MKSQILHTRMSEPMRYRFGVTSRAIAAVLGSYQLAAAIAFLARIEDVHWSWLLTPILQLFFLLWLFHARSASRVWLWLIVWTAAAYGTAWLVIHFGGIGA